MVPNVASMAADVMNHVRYNKWDQKDRVNMPENIQAERASVRPGVYAQWVITWEQLVYLGKEEPEFCIDAEPYYSHAPDIGPEHENDYVPVEVPVCDEQ